MRWDAVFFLSSWLCPNAIISSHYLGSHSSCLLDGTSFCLLASLHLLGLLWYSIDDVLILSRLQASLILFLGDDVADEEDDDDEDCGHEAVKLAEKSGLLALTPADEGASDIPAGNCIDFSSIVQ